MSISATNNHGYRVLSVSGAPVNPSLISMFCWAKSTADPSAYRGFVWLDTADGLGPDTGLRFGTDGSDSIRVRATTGAAGITDSGDVGQYFYESGKRNAWTAVGGYFYGNDASTDCKAFWYGGTDTVSSTANSVSGNQLTGTLDDFYVLANNYVGPSWGGQSASSSANLRVAHVAIWVGYKLTASDMTALKSGTNPQDIGGSASARWYWPLTTAAGSGLVDSISSVALAPFGGSATETWHDADNPTVSAPALTPAPVLSAPTAGTPDTTTITVSVTSNRASDGTMYFLRRVGGTQALDTAIISTGESQSATANPQSRVMTSYTAGSTNNIVDIVQVGAGGISNVVSTSAFTMASAAATIAPISCPSHASQSGFSGAILSAAAPGTGVTVISTFTGLSFNGAGNASVSVVGLGLSPGTVRYVIGTQSDGSLAPGTNPRCFQGPVELT